MKYLELKERISQNIFSLLDVLKLFPEEKLSNLRTQLYRFAKKKLIFQLKRAVYCFDLRKVEDFVLANILQPSSYISLESGLSYFGIIPDVALTITSVTLARPKKISREASNFIYVKIKPDLFFGYQQVKSSEGEAFFSVAHKEKALLDFFYLRKIKKIQGMRLKLEGLDRKLYRQYAASFPEWVRKIKIDE